MPLKPPEAIALKPVSLCLRGTADGYGGTSRGAIHTRTPFRSSIAQAASAIFLSSLE